jgi:hypothetical protein
LPVVGSTETLAPKPESTATQTVSEKFAATVATQHAIPVSGVKPSIRFEKNKFLTVDGEKLTTDITSAGTRTAKRGEVMSFDSTFPAAQRFAESDSAPAGAALSATSSTAFAAPRGTTSELSTVQPAQAAQIVREIRDIADGLWAVERQSVEVKFHFSEHERLAVRVQYRDGVVETTFRTDSRELRDTLAREWQMQAVFAEARPYRVAEPVFSTQPADARGFSLGGDASRQQQRQPEQAAPALHSFATSVGRATTSGTAAIAQPSRLERPDTTLHLHAFA